jgi:hypothetical protein
MFISRRVPLAGVLAMLLFCATSAAQAPAFSPQQVCRATIAAVMRRDPAIIRVARTTDEGVVYVTYARPDDGTVWTQRCRFEGAKVIWATSTGRWRTHPAEDVITFSSTASSLTIVLKHPDGTSTLDTFTRRQLHSDRD